MALSRHPGEEVNPAGSRTISASESTIVVDASSQEPLMLPSGQFASDAEYVQQGDDLLLVGVDGLTVIVRDYFLSDPAPDLQTPEGGRLTPSMVDSFTPPEAVGQYAQAGDSAATPIGQTTSIVGKVFVVRANGIRESIGAGDPIYQGDVIETADDAAVDVLFIDQTTFALGGDARLAIDKLVFDPDTQEGSSSYSVLKGMFVFSSGEIAKVNPLDMTVKTTVATIGIRGTTVAGDVKPAGEESKFTILEGEIIVTTDAGFVVLSEANETTFVTGFGSAPSEAVLFSDSEIDGFYSDVKSISDDYYGAEEKNQRASNEQNDEPDLDKLAESFDDLAPAAGSEADGGTGGEGDQTPTGPTTLLRVDEEPFRTEAEQQFNLTKNAGDEVGGTNDEGLAPGSTGNDGDNGGGAFGGIAAPGGDSQPGVGEGEGSTGGFAGFDFRDATGAVSVSGTEGDDTIFGGAGNDLLEGGGGNDSITGGNGNDSITGGDGNDVVAAGDGDDVIVGGTGAGDDSYDGGEGNDTVVFSSSSSQMIINLQTGVAWGAETDNDSITNVENVVGGSGNDIIIGNESDNILDGGDGRDTLDGGAGDDVLRGGADADVYRVTLGTGSDRIEDTGGNGDRLVLSGLSKALGELNGTSRVGDDLLIDLADGQVTIVDHFGNGTIEAITFKFDDGTEQTFTLSTGKIGGDADGVITGTDASETLNGGGGDDIIIGKGGNDLLIGGFGDDLFLTGDGNNGFDRVEGGLGFDRIEGTDEDDVIGLQKFSGDRTVEQIDGGAGNNVIRGSAGVSVLDFSKTTLLNIAQIESGAGSDIITGSSGDDVIVGQSGNDLLNGGSGDDRFLVSGANHGFDKVSGDEGFDRIEGSAGDDVIGLSKFIDDQTVEEINGSGGFDIIRGDSGANKFDFSDTSLIDISRIEGGDGSDSITGSTGNDTIVGESGNDFLNGGAGNDLFQVSGSGDGFDRVTGGQGFDRIEGSAGDDVIGLSKFSGDQIVEEINGGGGFDVIRGDSAVTKFDFSETTLVGISRIEGGAGADLITGSTGDDTIAGEAGNDVLAGGAGDDVLIGGSGLDRLSGDEGNDRFVIEGDNFALIDGGEGMDTIEIDFALDLGSVNDSNLRGIESFDLGGGADAALTIGLDDVLAATDGINALTESENTLVIRRDGNGEVDVVGDDWVMSEDTLDTDGDDVAEGYTVFHDDASGATVYVENLA